MKSIQFKFPKYEKFKSKKLTVVIIDNGYFMYKQFEDAFFKKKYNVNVFKLKIGEDISSDYYYRKFIDDLSIVKPDFIFTINFIGFDSNGKLMAMLNSIEIPIFCYLIDTPFLVFQNNEKNIESNFLNLFVVDSQWIVDINKMFPDRNIDITQLPLAVSEEIIKFSDSFKNNNANHKKSSNQSLFYHGFTSLDTINSLNPTPNKIFSYIENNSQTEEPVLSELNLDNTEILSYINDLKEDFMKKILINHDIISIFEEFERKNDIVFEFKELKILLRFYYKILLEVDLELRSSVLTLLSKSIRKMSLDLKIEGDINWINQLNLKIANTSDTVSHEELLELYNTSDFTLNIQSHSLPFSITQKTLETFICDGFLVTDNRKELDLILPKEYKYFDSNKTESINETIEYYKFLDKEKKEVTKYAKDKILTNKRYVNSIDIIENTISKKYQMNF